MERKQLAMYYSKNKNRNIFSLKSNKAQIS